MSDGDKLEYVIGSGNVYKDFGFPNPDESKAKADLATLITAMIHENNLTEQKAAAIIGINQTKISNITLGILSEFTLEHLEKIVLKLKKNHSFSLEERE